MRLPVLAAFATMVCTAAACAGDGGGGLKPDPFEGLYLASSETHNDDACDAEGPDIGAPTQEYFRLDIDSFFGTRALGWFGCTSATECDEDLNLLFSFYEKDENDDWTTTVWSGPYYIDSACEFSEGIRTLSGDPEGEIRIDTTLSSTSALGMSQAECEDADVEALVDEYRDQLICHSYQVLRADVQPE